MIFAVAMISAASVYAKSNAHWGYSGHEGPKNWATLTVDNFACSGKNQSPVNLTGFIAADLKPLKFNYQLGGYEIINNGHTVQVNYENGSSLELDGQTFNLLQVHFHAPSENHINGQSYPMKAHLVHANEQGDLAVVAIMFKQGIPNKDLAVKKDKYGNRVIVATPSANRWLKTIWSKMPKNAGEKHALLEKVNVADILPKDQAYYRFNGSLTTPPCSEGVRWLVIKDIVPVEKQQINAFINILHEPNNRPIQPINSRNILQ